MKNRNIFSLVLIFLTLYITGCVMAATARPYSFAENGSGNGTAKITFVYTQKEGVDLHFFEDRELPIPERGSYYWAPITFPAGRPFTLTVNVYKDRADTGKEQIFYCPALTAGRDYKLAVKKGVLGIGNKLVLTDASFTRLVVYEQVVER
jgi:hypothetical protein